LGGSSADFFIVADGHASWIAEDFRQNAIEYAEHSEKRKALSE
jgi:hypothetical protein